MGIQNNIVDVSQQKLHWKVKHNTDFSKEPDFLETLLVTNGVPQEQIKDFLSPKLKHLHSPFLMNNMKEAIQLVHKHVANGSNILVRVDVDVDGYTSASILGQFLQKLNPNITIEYKMNYEKRHGLTMEDMQNYTRDEFDLIVIPDASMIVRDARQIVKNFDADILVLDHHLVDAEFFDKETNQQLSREQAKELYKNDKDKLLVDYYTNYCLAVNSTDGNYPNPHLSGAGVVQKFIEGYYEFYKETEEINRRITDYYLDLVSLGLIADAMDARDLETRYYMLEGLREYNYNNDFLNELCEKKSEELKWGRTIGSIGWYIAPLINGTIRYGSPEEQDDLFNAMLGVQEIRDYQPRRAKASDPKPPLEHHSLQKTMARVCVNVKSRQDTEVRKFVKELDKQIEEKKLANNSVLFVDGTKVLTKGTVSGLVANKLASKYFRPVVLLRDKSATEYGGSIRGYEQGPISNFKEFLEKAGAEAKGHSNAAGFFLAKDKLDEVIKNCNKMMPLKDLCTIHTVDWEIEAGKLKRSYVQEVAENYEVFGNTVPEPLFAISDLHIESKSIAAYGTNNSFIRFTYNGISFVKKYCSANEYDIMTMKGRNALAASNKSKLLVLNLIAQFTLNAWEDKINPEVKILYFDVREDGKENDADVSIDNAKAEKVKKAEKKEQKKQKEQEEKKELLSGTDTSSTSSISSTSNSKVSIPSEDDWDFIDDYESKKKKQIDVIDDDFDW